PPPDRGPRDRRHDASADHLRLDVGNEEPGQRQIQPGRELTGDCLDLNRHLWGKKSPVVLGGEVPRGRPAAARRSAFATARPPPGGYPGAWRSRRCEVPGLPAGRSWLGPHLDTATYIFEPWPPGPGAPRRSVRCCMGCFSACSTPPRRGTLPYSGRGSYVSVIMNRNTKEKIQADTARREAEELGRLREERVGGRLRWRESSGDV